MKKLKLFITLVIFSALAHQAQAQAQIALGLKGGLNFAKLDVNSSLASNIESRTGYHAGAFGLIKVAMIGIQPEIIFSKQGTKYQVNTQDLEANFDYINVPIIFKLYLAAGFNLQAGPQFGFLSKAEFQDAVTNATTDVKGFYKDTDTSLALGIGWDLPLGIIIDARYNIGLSDISNNSLTPETKNQVIQISAGFKILKLGK
jgi:Outer membrane protein beta-barrel domain